MEEQHVPKESHIYVLRLHSEIQKSDFDLCKGSQNEEFFFIFRSYGKLAPLVFALDHVNYSRWVYLFLSET